MQRIRVLAPSLSLLLLAGCAAGAGAASGGAETATVAAYAVADPVAEADALSQEAARLFDVPGMAVAIVVGDEVVFSRGYGALDVTREAGAAGDNAVNDATSFAIASNTKAFTATALGLLVADGEIGWDDRVVDHLPELKLWDDYVTRELRVRDLLSHRVGLSTWAGDLMWLSSNYDRETILARLQHLPPDFSFRERYGYCNLMFMVAGELIERKTGVLWDAYIKTRILDPLGMADVATRVGQLDGKDNVATAHIEVDGAWTTTPYLDLEAVGPAASFHANVLDLSRWVRMQLADGTFEGTQVVPKAVIFETRQPHIWLPLGEEDYMEPRRHLLGYGLGWYLADYRGELLVTHGGGMPGMTSRVLMFPESDVGVIVLTSSESPASSALAMNLADLYLAGAGDPRKNYVTAAHERMLAAKADEIDALVLRLTAMSKGLRPDLAMRAASFPAWVVFPAPCNPAKSTVAGLPFNSSGAAAWPMSLVSSSWVILIRSCPG